MVFKQEYKCINIFWQEMTFSLTTFSVTLKTRSDGTLVAINDQTPCRNLEMCGYVV